LGQAKRGGRSYTVRHTGDISTKLHEARNVMNMTINYYEQFKQFGDQMALEKISANALETRVLDKLYPTEEGMGERAVKNKTVAKEAILSIFNGMGVRGDTTGNAPGTKWCAANAIAEYTDYGRKMTKRGNQVGRSFEDNMIKQRGFDLVLSA
jgi:hypothetical protein